MIQENGYNDAFPAMQLGAVSNDCGSYESQSYSTEWGGYEQEEWPITRAIAAVTRGKGNKEENKDEEVKREEEEKFTEVTGKRRKKKNQRVRVPFRGCDHSIHIANTHNKYNALNTIHTEVRGCGISTCIGTHEKRMTKATEEEVPAQRTPNENRYKIRMTPKINNTCNVVQICRECGEVCDGDACQSHEYEEEIKEQEKILHEKRETELKGIREFKLNKAK